MTLGLIFFNHRPLLHLGVTRPKKANLNVQSPWTAFGFSKAVTSAAPTPHSKMTKFKAAVQPAKKKPTRGQSAYYVPSKFITYFTT